MSTARTAKATSSSPPLRCKAYGPFYPGTWHDGPGKQLSIGFEGANVVQEVFARTRGNFPASVAELTRQLTVHAKVAEAIGERIASAKGWIFMGVDPTPAPLGDVSIGAAIETYTGANSARRHADSCIGHNDRS